LPDRDIVQESARQFPESGTIRRFLTGDSFRRREDAMATAGNVALEALQALVGQKFDQSPSPFGRWLAPTVIAVAADGLSFGYEVREDMCNPGGSLHGGVSAAIADDIIGTTVFCSGWSSAYATIHSSIEYFSLARRGQHIVATTLIGDRSARLLSADCRICTAKGRLLVRVSSRLIRLSAR